jgi:AcrR family transcriptional regulator
MQKRNVGRPRAGDTEVTRRDILRAAEECFATSGFVGATTRHVAARAGVNVATLHYHFGNKGKLYRAVLDTASAAEPVAVPGAGKGPVERLSSLVEALWDYGAAHPSLPRLSLLHRLSGPPSPAETIEDPRVALLTRTLAETGVKTPFPPGEAAKVILAFLDSGLVASQSGRALQAVPPSAVALASRAGVVAAALRVTGLA